MNTVQKYAGKGNSAHNPSQTVETRRFAPLSPDERSALVDELNDVQDQLLTLVDDFASIQGGTDPVSAIASLLQNLLVNPTTELADDLTRDNLKVGLMLIGFLSEARTLLFQRSTAIDLLQAGKEVSNG